MSRNVPVWHDTLELTKSESAYRHYKLNKKYLEIRIHRDLDSDFYYPLAGRRSVKTFINPLEKNLEKKNYINFLKKEYKKNGVKLLALSKNLKPTTKSLKIFLNYYGYCTPLLVITSWSSKILTDKLIFELRDNPDRDAIIRYYSIPKQLAPVQRLEKELDKLCGHKNLDKASERLWKNFHWIPVSFVGESWDKKYFLNLLKIRTKIVLTAPQKPEGKLSAKLKHLLWALSQVTYLNEYRKEIFCQVSLKIRPVLNKLAKAAGLKDWKEVSLLTHDELILAATGKNLSKLVARRQKESFAVHNIDGVQLQIVYGLEVKKFEDKLKTKNINAAQFNGVVGNKGKVVGKVKLVLNYKDFNKFKAGNILVAKMTSVDYLPIMKKAIAFITDEGGLACHAAVVAREFNLPCIIGTKIATAVLKDGDIIEVDAHKGIVRKINI